MKNTARLALGGASLAVLVLAWDRSRPRSNRWVEMLASETRRLDSNIDSGFTEVDALLEMALTKDFSGYEEMSLQTAAYWAVIFVKLAPLVDDEVYLQLRRTVEELPTAAEYRQMIGHMMWYSCKSTYLHRKFMGIDGTVDWDGMLEYCFLNLTPLDLMGADERFLDSIIAATAHGSNDQYADAVVAVLNFPDEGGAH